MTPEMKRMAKGMGLDIDELIAEDNKIQDRRQQLDMLKREHEDQQQYKLTLEPSSRQLKKNEEIREELQLLSVGKVLFQLLTN